MPEPTSTATVTVLASTLVVQTISIMGVSIGLRPDLLVAGFSGAIVSIALLNSVPAGADTWRELLRTTLRRIAFSVAGSLTAAYLTPVVMLIAQLPDPLILGSGFAVGAGAQRVLTRIIARINSAPGDAS